MITLLVRTGLALLVLNQFLTPAEAHRYGNYGDYYNRQTGYKDPGQPKTIAGYSSGLPSQNATRKGLGISAWGLVFLIVGLILAGLGLYYFSICYSVCQPSKGKYDKMGMPTLA